MSDGVNAHMEFTEEEDKERRKIREEEGDDVPWNIGKE